MRDVSLADAIDALLPQTQCTRCGYPTCHAYADAIARDEADIDRCPPGGADGVAALAHLLGRAPKPLDPAHGSEEAPTVASIDEDICIGCTKCIQACPVDAIVGAAKRMHTVIAGECTGCGLCLPPCPVDCIVLVAVAGEPLAREQVLERAGHARARFVARNARLRHLAGAASAALPSEPPPSTEGLGGDCVAGEEPRIAAEAVPGGSSESDRRRITRSAVLEAIARGKARRGGAKDPPSR